MSAANSSPPAFRCNFRLPAPTNVIKLTSIHGDLADKAPSKICEVRESKPVKFLILTLGSQITKMNHDFGKIQLIADIKVSLGSFDDRENLACFQKQM
jgi:hypothetical protein